MFSTITAMALATGASFGACLDEIDDLREKLADRIVALSQSEQFAEPPAETVGYMADSLDEGMSILEDETLEPKAKWELFQSYWDTSYPTLAQDADLAVDGVEDSNALIRLAGLPSTLQIALELRFMPTMIGARISTKATAEVEILSDAALELAARAVEELGRVNFGEGEWFDFGKTDIDERAEDLSEVAHELTHVVQQQAARSVEKIAVELVNALQQEEKSGKSTAVAHELTHVMQEGGAQRMVSSAETELFLMLAGDEAETSAAVQDLRSSAQTFDPLILDLKGDGIDIKTKLALVQQMMHSLEQAVARVADGNKPRHDIAMNAIRNMK